MTQLAVDTISPCRDDDDEQDFQVPTGAGRKARSGDGTGGAPTMQRKLRKNTREKQRRLELNDKVCDGNLVVFTPLSRAHPISPPPHIQFEELRAMLPIGRTTKQRQEK